MYMHPDTMLMTILTMQIHVDENGELIPPDASPFIWLGALVGNRKLNNTAISSDAAFINSDDPHLS